MTENVWVFSFGPKIVAMIFNSPFASLLHFSVFAAISSCVVSCRSYFKSRAGGLDLTGELISTSKEAYLSLFSILQSVDGWLFRTLFIKCQHPVEKKPAISGQHARMENDIEKEDVDIFKDTPVRYLGI